MARYKYQEYNTAWTRVWRLKNREKHVLRAAKANAKRQGLDFDLEVEDICFPEVCPVLGIKLFFTDGCRTDNTPSLDKIYPERGYVKGNVQIISWKANKLKNNATLEELVALGKWAENEISRD